MEKISFKKNQCFDLWHCCFDLGLLRGVLASIIFLDVQTAFSKVWQSSLFWKIINTGFQRKLVKIFCDNNSLSSTWSLRRCPKLFNIYINVIPRIPDVKLEIFASGTATTVTHIHSLCSLNTKTI